MTFAKAGSLQSALNGKSQIEAEARKLGFSDQIQEQIEEQRNKQDSYTKIMNLEREHIAEKSEI